MNIESEKALETHLKNSVNKLGGLCFKFLPFYVNGLPDRICLLPKGRVFFAEIKTTKKETTTLQKMWISKFKKLGFLVAVLDTTEKINDLLEIYAP